MVAKLVGDDEIGVSRAAIWPGLLLKLLLFESVDEFDGGEELGGLDGAVGRIMTHGATLGLCAGRARAIGNVELRLDAVGAQVFADRIFRQRRKPRSLPSRVMTQ